MFDADFSRHALRAVAFYLPQYHPIPENDVFWGKGFTEWRNVTRARPRFTGHLQPHMPADLGFYDLRLPEVRDAQAALARAAGLHGFCYYHYWFSGRRLLNRPFDEVLSSGAPSFPFMLAWANENWTRAWDGGAREVLLDQTYSDDDTIAHARHLVPAFGDLRYIRVGDRPAFAVYNTDEIPDPRRWSDLFRETLLTEGFSPYLLRIERYLDRDRRSPAELGFDAAVEFQPFSRSFHHWLKTRPDLKANPVRRFEHRISRELRRFRPRDRHHDMKAFVHFDMGEPQPDYPCFPGVCPSWDNSARRPPSQAIIFRNTSPALFAEWIAAKRDRWQASGPDEDFLFINAWNEWAEGNHLEPCLAHGHEWLNAVQRALAENSTCTR